MLDLPSQNNEKKHKRMYTLNVLEWPGAVVARAGSLAGPRWAASVGHILERQRPHPASRLVSLGPWRGPVCTFRPSRLCHVYEDGSPGHLGPERQRNGAPTAACSPPCPGLLPLAWAFTFRGFIALKKKKKKWHFLRDTDGDICSGPRGRKITVNVRMKNVNRAQRNKPE